MAFQKIAIGATPNDGQGTPFRSGAEIINGNFDAVSASFSRSATAQIVPNLFDLPEIQIQSWTHLYAAANTLTPTPGDYEGIPCWQAITPDGASANSTIRWEFPASSFANGRIAASMRIFSLSSVSTSSPCTLSIAQYNGSHGTIGGATVTETLCDRDGISSPDNYDIQAALDPSCVYVQLQISISRLGGSRTIKFSNLSITDGIVDFAMPPVNIPKFSIFPDPSLQGIGTTTAQWTAGIEGGEHIMSATGAGTLQEIWSMPSSSVIQPGDKLTWSADIYSDAANGADLTLIQYDSSGSEISRLQANATTANAWQTVTTSLVLDSDVARVDARLVRRSTATIGKIRRVSLGTSSSSLVINTAQTSGGGGSGDGLTTILVDAVNGSDDNDGIAEPVKTFAAAMALATANTILLVAAGDYTDCPSFGVAENLEVRALTNEHVRMIGGTKVTGATLVSGKTQTYQASVATSPSNWIFYHDVPEEGTLISDDDRLPIQEGREYRLPMTRIWPVESADDVESASLPSWYWESGTLYFSVPAGQDANGGVYIPNASTFPFSGGTGGQRLRAVGVQSFYWAKGFGPTQCSLVEMLNCRAYGASVDGFSPDDCRFVRLTRCESGGNNNDGAGGHQTSPSTVLEGCHYVGDNCWYHDNWDDGESYHEGWTATDYGGLVEYNGDRGVVTANGGHSSHYDMRARANGQNTGASTFNGGAGFCCAGTASDGGIGTQMELYNCISERNPINYSVNIGNRLDANGCSSLLSDSGATHFMQSGGTMMLRDCSYSGDGTLKSGTITVANTTAVT